MKRLLAVTSLAAAAMALCACSSSSSTTTAMPTGGTETLSAAVTGAAAAANLDNSNPNAPLVLGHATLSGPVSGTITPFTLGGNSSKGTITWLTTAGPLTVFHRSSEPASAKNAPPPATWVKSGSECHFSTVFDTGTFSQVGGPLVATTWSGTYKITAEGTAPLDRGKTACSWTTTGNAQDTGAAITFTASGPMTVKA
jgi:hypothetical protein